MAQKPVAKPGELAPKSGQYVTLSPNGKEGKNEITAVEGKPLPPTPNAGDKWVLVDPTKHKK